jgi:hypothetical protein
MAYNTFELGRSLETIETERLLLEPLIASRLEEFACCVSCPCGRLHHVAGSRDLNAVCV